MALSREETLSPEPMAPEMLEMRLQTCRRGVTSHGGTDPGFVLSLALDTLFCRVAPPHSLQWLHMLWVCKTPLTTHVLMGVRALSSFPL